jgi:glycosyltransferase involved in cell wall biosynthesis
VPEVRWRVLPNGLNLEYYRPDENLRRTFRKALNLGGTFAIGIACALRPRKQLEHLFEVARQLSDIDVKVLVAGAPLAEDADYARRLLKQGREMLGDRLLALGELTDLRGFYNGLDVYVNTSQEEACSLSVCEALASGCPLLGYPSRSVDTQVLPDGGEIVLQDDVNQLAATLRAWLNDRGALHDRRQRARRQAEDQFDTRKRSAELWEIYHDVMDEYGRNGKRHAV